MDFSDVFDDEYQHADYSTHKYKVTISADDESYVEPVPEPEKKSYKNRKTHGQTAPKKHTTANSTAKIGDIVYVITEKLLANRPRLNKYANDLYSEVYGLLQKMSIKSRRGKRANLAAFFVLYIATKKLKLGVDPVLLAMDIGLTSKDTVSAIEEFIPPLNTTNPLEIEILELIYMVEITDIAEEYFERMWILLRKPYNGEPSDTEFWKKVGESFKEWSYDMWKAKNTDSIEELIHRKIENGDPDNRIHIISPQKLYVLVMYNTIRNTIINIHSEKDDKESESGITSSQEKCLQRIFANQWGQIANNLDKTRKKTVGLN